MHADLAKRVVQERQREQVRDRPDRLRRGVLREEHTGEEELRERDELRDRRHLVLGLRPAGEGEADREEEDRPEERDGHERNEPTDDRDVEEQKGDEEQHRDLAGGDDEPRQDVSGQEVGDADGGGHDPAEHAALLVGDERERDREDRQLHDVHAEDPGDEKVDVAQPDALHRLVLHPHDRRRLGHRERQAVDDRGDDRTAHRDLLRPRVVPVDDELRHRLTRARRRDREVAWDHDEHVELSPSQFAQRLVRRELGDLQRADAAEHPGELLAGGVLRLVVDGDGDAAEIAEVQVPEDHHEHERDDETEEEGDPVTDVRAQQHRGEAVGLPHASRSS